MKLKICMIVLCLLSKSGYNQNLVPNPSFELFSSCPTNSAQIYYAVGWSSYRETPDYYNRCFLSCNPPFSWCVGVPDNDVGSQEAIGNAYAGIVTFNDTDTTSICGLDLLFREIIGVHLLDTLIIGNKYFVSAYVSLALSWRTERASNNIGFKFSTVSFTMNDSININNFAHVNSDSIIVDTNNWVKIGGSFIADSAYGYLAIGNFFDNQHTNTFSFDTLECSALAYYYIDYVCVSPDSLECAQNFVSLPKINHESVRVFPNPFRDELMVRNENNEAAEIIVYDVFSRKVFWSSFIDELTFSTSHLADGLYLYEVRNRSGAKSRGKVLKE